MYQMYEKELDHQVSNSFNYIGLTNRPDLLERLQGVSPKSMRIVLQVIGKMQMRPFGKVEDLIEVCIVDVDWEAVGVTDRYKRSKYYKELERIGFWMRSEGQYVINLWYLSAFTKKQHEQLSNHLQMMRFTEAQQ